MKIKYIKEDHLITIKENLEAIYDFIYVKNQSIDELLGDKVLQDSPYEIDDFSFYMPEVNSNREKASTDFENVKKLYGNLKALSESQATDERLWAAFVLSDGLDYMKYRWTPQSAKDLKNRYFFFDGSKKSLFRNGIARLWWIGRMTYDSKLEDPYLLTRFLCTHQDYIESFFGRNIFANTKVLHATLKALMKVEKDGYDVNAQVVRDLAKYLIVEGAVSILDIFSENELFDKVYNYCVGIEDDSDEKENSLSIYFELAELQRGQIVIHKIYNEGIIDEIDDKTIRIKFGYDIKTFEFPKAFIDGYLIIKK